MFSITINTADSTSDGNQSVGPATMTSGSSRVQSASMPTRKSAVRRAQTLRSSTAAPTIILENDHVALTFSVVTGALAEWKDKASGLVMEVNHTFCYYPSNIGDTVHPQPSGAYIFRPEGQVCVPMPTPTLAGVHFERNGVVGEVKQFVAPHVIACQRSRVRCALCAVRDDRLPLHFNSCYWRPPQFAMCRL